MHRVRPFRSTPPMVTPSLDALRSPRIRRWLGVAVLALLGIWLLFLDSHSLVRRALWHHEYAQLRAENERLRTDIDALDETLEAGISDDEIERIAREQYGMRRAGETVYRVDAE